MNKNEFVISLLLYGVLGWCIDSFARMIRYGDWINGTALQLPWSPMYALGAIGIVFIYARIKHLHIIWQFVFFAVLISSYEFIGGLFSLKAYGAPLWNYSTLPLNIGGHTTVPHAIGWGVLGLILTHLLHPVIVRIAEYKK